MAGARMLIVGLAVALLALLAAAPASALPRAISWASPPGPGGPFTQSSGVAFPSTNGVSEVCGERREKIDPGIQAIVTASTPDGSRVFFLTEDKLSAADTDVQQFDIYEFSGGQTKLVTGAGGGLNTNLDMYMMACSQDGSRVIFSDGADLWQGSGNGVTSKVNVSETFESNNAIAENVAISADGTKVFFDTFESLTSDDADSPAAYDVFERSGNDTKLVSAPGTAEVGTTLAAVSADGSRVYMDSSDQLAPATDTNSGSDVYVSVNSGAPTVVSLDTTTGLAAGLSSFFRGATPNGGHVFFTSTSDIDGTDVDGNADLYDRNGSATTWISKPDPGETPDNFPNLFAVSADGSRVYFVSDGQLKATDTDGAQDLYMRTASGLTHITKQVAGPANPVVAGCTELSVMRGCANADASLVFFSTQERLTAADTDPNEDIYRFTAATGALQLVSGVGSAEIRLAGASANGTRTVFDTTDRLLPAVDKDAGDSDVYEWDNGTLSLVTPAVGTGPQGNILSAISADASTLFFASNAQYAGSGNDGSLMDLFAARPCTPATCPVQAKPAAKPLADVIAPKATLSGAKTQRAGASVSVTVACDEACVASASGTVSVPGAAKTFKLGKARKSIRAGGRAKLKLKVSKKARRAIRKALRRKRKVRATIKLRIADQSGNTTRRTRKLKLKR